MGSELQTMNGQNKLALWAERVSACRSSALSVRAWCKENDICEQTYYRWQRKPPSPLCDIGKVRRGGQECPPLPFPKVPPATSLYRLFLLIHAIPVSDSTAVTA